MVRDAGFARPHHEDRRRRVRPSILVLRGAERAVSKDEVPGRGAFTAMRAHPGFAASPPNSEGDGAPRSAVRIGVVPLAGTRGRLAARQSQRPYGLGPRFNPGLSVRDLPASSWRGLVVVPGGAPLPPECFVATRLAGAAPRPAHHDASRKRPSNGRGDRIVRQVFGAGIRLPIPERRPGESRGPVLMRFAHRIPAFARMTRIGGRQA